ncbi:hypothetical protein AVEN_82501-1 [Araneus ventricosus]|uniref:Mos1 transposase HTH domain-containing protein n=1 Tax=Araneus ventricosus TaxID=182803 RepID=A0A4Y2R9Y2_ARAVE|nr:hypothetical protein AVEN_139482-1 [Araneus ventricosus]GBN72826.1 hypothetical protein AVEN_82501-1 [Araneus ventricosus]
MGEHPNGMLLICQISSRIEFPKSCPLLVSQLKIPLTVKYARTVIYFLNAKDVKAANIHRQISEVYGENITSEGMVRKWVRAFKDGRRNVHDKERSGRFSLITEDLVQIVDEKVRENRRFTISSLSDEFPEVSGSVFYGIVTEHLNYRKLCFLWAGDIFL